MPKRIFISHKNRDRELGKDIKDHLLERVKPGKGRPALDVFLSSDAESIVRGKPWLNSIHDALQSADCLILLYTDQRQVWDWCLYEAGYFARRFKSLEDARDLFVFHPKGIVPPAPLQPWQTVPSEPIVIDGVLKQIYKTRTGSCFDGTDKARMEIAREIAAQIGAFARAPVFAPNRLMLTLVAVPNPTPGPGEPHFQRIAKAEPALAALLRVSPNLEVPWDEFFASAGVKQSRLDCGALTVLLGRLVSAKSIQDVQLPACILANAGYRPLLDQAERDMDGKTSLTIVFQPIPNNLDATSSNAFEILAQLVAWVWRFRSVIVEKYAILTEPGSVAPLAPPDPVAPRDVATAAKSLLHDVDRHVSESMAAGLDSEAKIKLAFAPAVHNLLDEASAMWRDGYCLLSQMVARRAEELETLRQAFRKLRLASFQYLQLTVKELQERTSAVPAPPAPAPAAPAYSATAPRPAMPSVPHDGAAGETRGWLKRLFGTQDEE